MEGTFVGFTDGIIFLTQNLTSDAWMIYAPTGKLVVLGGACLGPSTNNVAEYNAVIKLVCDTNLNGILYL